MINLVVTSTAITIDSNRVDSARCLTSLALPRIPGPWHCRGEFGLRRALFHGEEIVRPAHQRALRDTGTAA